MHTMIDAGVNLTSAQFDKDRADVIQRAKDAKINNMLLIGCDLITSQESLDLAKTHQFVSTAGIHPHDAKDAPEDYIAQITQLARAPQVVAIGECGLDFNRDFSPRDQQEKICRAQLALAQQLNMPAYLHERDAHERMRALLLEHRIKGVLHCFTGDRQALKFYLDYGLMIGVTGWVCDERRGQQLRELIQYIPSDRLLIETDAPYLLPRTLSPKPKSRRNEPAYLHAVAEQIALLKNTDVDTIAAHSRDNFNALFMAQKQSAQ
ncbi:MULTISPECIES: TatD family hydrolase [Pseudoalteromonas]|uniref:TatD family hydrolase n=1 Tax=Pseudoalteromonas obscura TaxID=3048491 RepID=A0ABT7ET58_9GAMM|nr:MULTISPECIES: TatD family hydrolase [Pseudoalteromonas]MBQ4839682.1 TatD family hydrolase [Pseudoalteromonas luteoviolacea]MDK2598238.1 TatD family hydrolase [Pseudoalteromonas sp. P94(2023)]